MSWLNNMVSYSAFGQVGVCPSCGSKDVEVLKHSHGGRTSITFNCKACKSSDHFDGVATKNTAKQ